MEINILSMNQFAKTSTTYQWSFDSVHHFWNVTNTTNILIMQLINRMQIFIQNLKIRWQGRIYNLRGHSALKHHCSWSGQTWKGMYKIAVFYCFSKHLLGQRQTVPLPPPFCLPYSELHAGSAGRKKSKDESGNLLQEPATGGHRVSCTCLTSMPRQ